MGIKLEKKAKIRIVIERHFQDFKSKEIIRIRNDKEI